VIIPLKPPLSASDYKLLCLRLIGCNGITNKSKQSE
jgi:hypothetical protein